MKVLCVCVCVLWGEGGGVSVVCEGCYPILGEMAQNVDVLILVVF